MTTLFPEPVAVTTPAAIRFTVPAVPVAQPRPRAVQGHNGHARMHEVTHIKNADGTRKPHPIAAFKATVRMAAEQAYQGPPLEGPLRMTIVFVFPRTTSQIWKTRPMPRLHHTKTPDRDNCEKAVMDALKGTVFADDAQVCCGEVSKWIAAGDEQPHVEVTIEQLP